MSLNLAADFTMYTSRGPKTLHAPFMGSLAQMRLAESSLNTSHRGFFRREKDGDEGCLKTTKDLHRQSHDTL